MCNRWLSVVLICGLIIFSCSIKEDRSGCPGMLILDLNGINGSLYDSLRVRVEATDDFLYNEIINKSEYDKPLLISVPRTDLSVAVYAGDNNAINYTLSGLTIPYGDECYSVFMDNDRIFMDKEVYHKNITLYKNYSHLNINLIHQGRAYPFDIEIRGSISGYDMFGKPNNGKFSYATKIDENGKADVKIPRQIDGSLELIILDKKEQLRKFAIGEYIIESGFDWKKLDLEDITIDINYTLTEIKLIIANWEKSFSLDITI